MPYPLRMPEDMREALESARRDSGRSLNAEIVARLEQSLSHCGLDDSELPDAEDLRRASEVSLMEVREAVWSEVVKNIVNESRFGRRECYVQLSRIEGLDPDSYTHAEILKFVRERLEGKGYSVEQPTLGELEVKW